MVATGASLALGAGLAVIGALGPALGIGLIGSKVIEGASRQPEIANDLQVKGLIFAALCEALGLGACAVGFKLAGIF